MGRSSGIGFRVFPADSTKSNCQAVGRKKNETLKSILMEIEKRLGAFWRNVVRALMHFWPRSVQLDAYDHAPSYRRGTQGQLLATKGGERVAAKEYNSGARPRCAVVSFASSDGIPKAPEAGMKMADARRMEDVTERRVLPSVAFRASPSAPYASTPAVAMIQEQNRGRRANCQA